MAQITGFDRSLYYDDLNVGDTYVSQSRTITAKRICSSKPQFAILERHTDVINQRDEVVLSYDSVVMIKTKRDDKPVD